MVVKNFWIWCVDCGEEINSMKQYCPKCITKRILKKLETEKNYIECPHCKKENNLLGFEDTQRGNNIFLICPDCDGLIPYSYKLQKES
jgi:Zn finger protein HypA/HybF involved in hydrogenase expression